MNDPAKTIDDKIREALRKEDAELLDAELLEHYRGEPALHEMLIETFRGRHRLLNLLAALVTFLLVGFVLVAGYQFFQAESTQMQIAWSTAVTTGVMAVVLLKIWFWLEMNKNGLTREIKRLELQIARLSRQGDAKG